MSVHKISKSMHDWPNALLKIVTAGASLLTVTSCSVWGQQGYINVSTVTANYTDMSVNYTFYDTTGKNLGLGGGAKPFSKGGTGGIECCARLPGPGQTVRVVWDEEIPGPNEIQPLHYSYDIVVTGSRPLPGDAYNYFITRFFPQQKVEVEFVSEKIGAGRSPRLDRVFYGQRVMRHIGE